MSLTAEACLTGVPQAMVWDTKLNSMQLTEGKLRKLIQQHQSVGEKGRCRLRVPTKRLV